jgi:hypothetical protein
MVDKVADLTIDVSTNTASVEIGFNKLADIIGQRARDIERSVGGIGSHVESLVAGFRNLAAIAGVSLGAHALVEFVTGIIDAQAHLEDLATKIGTTASEISKLIPAAKLSGTSLDTVATASAKFSRTLIDVQSELGKSVPTTNKAALAFQALGFNAQDAGRFLASPAEGLQEFARRLGEFQTDGTKTARVMELIGKNAQELLPFFKQLSEQSELTARVTDEQAAAAKRLQDGWATLQLNGEALRNSLATGLVEGLNQVLKAFNDAGGSGNTFGNLMREIADDHSLAIWVLQVADGFGEAGAAVMEVINTFRLFWNSAESTVHALQALDLAGIGDFEGAKQAWAEHTRAAGDFWKTWGDLAKKGNTDFHIAIQAQIKELQDLQEAQKGMVARVQYGEGQFGAESLNAAYGGKKKIPGGSDTTGVSEGAKALEHFKEMAAEANASLDAFLQGGKISAIAAAFEKLKASDVWKTLTQGQKEAIAGFVDFGNSAEHAKQAIEEMAGLSQQLEKGFAQYQASAAQLSKALAQSIANAQLAGIADEQTSLERSYQRGLVDLETYLDRKTQLQRDALRVQATLVLDEAAGFQKAVDAARDYLNSIDNGTAKFSTAAEMERARADARDRLNLSTKALVESGDKLLGIVLKETDAGRDNVEQMNQANSVIRTSVRNLTEQIEQQKLANETVGMTASQIQLVIAAKLQEAIVDERAHQNRDEVIADLQAQIDKRKELSGTLGQGENLQRQSDAWRQLFNDVSDAGARFIEDFVQHGTASFKRLWDDFKNWALSTFAKIAAQTVVVNILAAAGLGGAAVGNAFAQGQSPVGTLLGIGQTASGVGNIGSSVGSIAGIFTGAGTAGTSLAAAGANISLAATAGLDAVGGLSGLVAGILPALGTLFPIAALAAIAIPLVVGLFDKGPAERSGTFASGAAAGPGTGNPLFQSSSAFGNFGVINDKWFSDSDQGKAIQDFLAGIKGIDNAISSLVGNDMTERISAALASVQTEFEAGIEHQATSFGDVMKQRYIAVATTIDASLGALVTNFKGTGEELSKFVTSIVGVYETLQKIDTNTLFGQTVTTTDIVNLAGAGGDVAATFQHLVDVFSLTDGMVQLFSGNINEAFGAIGLASRDAREQLVDFLGGVQAAGSKFSSFLQTMLTDGERNTMAFNNASESLVDGFNRLGIAIPESHQAFVALVNAQDLSTEAGRQTYATLIDLSSAFVNVHGTAQALADGLNQVHDAERSLMTDSQRTADSWGRLHDVWAQHGADIFQLTGGQVSSIPTTNSGMVVLLHSLENMGDAGVALANILIRDAVPAVNDLNNVLAQSAQLAGSLHDTARSFMSDAQRIDDDRAILSNFWTQFGADINRITGFSSIPTSGTGAVRFWESLNQAVSDGVTGATELAHQISEGVLPAINDLNTSLQKVADNTRTFNDLLPEITQQTQGFADILNSAVGQLAGSVGDKLAFTLQTVGARLTEAQSGVDDAVKRGFNMDSLNYWLYQQAVATRDQAATLYHGFADDYARYVTLQAQFGSGIADQLFDLENTFSTLRAQAGGIGSDPALLDALNTAFNQKWQEIVNGTNAGVTATQDALANLMKSITDRFTTDVQKQAAALITLTSGFAKLGLAIPQTYDQFITFAQSTSATTDVISSLADAFITLHGTAQQAAAAIQQQREQTVQLQDSLRNYSKGLSVSESSPLTPQQQFSQASYTFNTDALAAGAGDTTALARIQSEAQTYLDLARTMFSIGQGYTDAFNHVQGITDYLGNATNIGGRQDPMASISSALPSGKLASQADVQAQTAATADLTDVVEQLLARIANATEATETNVASGSREIVNAIGTQRL